MVALPLQIGGSMKLDEIIMIKEHLRGRTLNYLGMLDDFTQIHVRQKTDSIVQAGQLVNELAQTRADESGWLKMTFSEHKWVEARFCASESQLRGFLGGRFDNIEEKVIFDESLCNAYCLDKVTSLGMKMDGSTNMKFRFTYKPLDTVFAQGAVYHNFNGSDYRVLEKLSARNLLLLDINSSNMVVAVGAGMYTRYPKEEVLTNDNQTIALEWDHGIYIGATPSRVDFALIREKYGEVKKVVTLEDYRQQQRELFRTYKKISDNPNIDTFVKEAATNAMYDTFMTGREDVFTENLNAAKYDVSFKGEKAVEKVQVR